MRILKDFLEELLFVLFVKPKCRKQKSSSNRILVLDMEFIGDSVMILPMINSLRQNRNIDKIDVLCYEQQKDVFLRCEDVDDVINIRSITELKKNSIFPGLGKDIYKFFYTFYVVFCIVPKILNHYDVLLCPRENMGSQEYMEKVAFFCGIERRYGYSWYNIPKERELRRKRCFTNLVYASGKYIWPYESSLEFVELCGYKKSLLKVSLRHYDVQNIGEIAGLSKYVVFAMDTTNNMREWPIEKFSSLGKKFSSEGYNVVLLGTKKKYGCDYKKGCDNYKVVDLIGKTTISEAIDIIGNAKYYVGGDTGLSHIAGAVGCRGVILFPHKMGCDLRITGIPETCRPYGTMKCLQPKETLSPCVDYCHSRDKAHCITQISVNDVWNIAKQEIRVCECM